MIYNFFNQELKNERRDARNDSLLGAMPIPPVVVIVYAKFVVPLQDSTTLKVPLYSPTPISARSALERITVLAPIVISSTGGQLAACEDIVYGDVPPLNVMVVFGLAR